MIFAGDVYLADLNEERRLRVLVMSNDRFSTASGRVLVAPEIAVEPGEVLFPWRVVVGNVDAAAYAIDLARSLPCARLLDRVDRVPAATMAAVRRVLLNIT